MSCARNQANWLGELRLKSVCVRVSLLLGARQPMGIGPPHQHPAQCGVSLWLAARGALFPDNKTRIAPSGAAGGSIFVPSYECGIPKTMVRPLATQLTGLNTNVFDEASRVTV